MGQLVAVNVENPNLLWMVSGFCGMGYGVLFGVFPALVVDAFGPDGFAVNWGCMTLAPVVSGNIFNLFYGAIYDSHSVVEPDGQRSCELGLQCYQTAYYLTLTSRHSWHRCLLLGHVRRECKNKEEAIRAWRLPGA